MCGYGILLHRVKKDSVAGILRVIILILLLILTATAIMLSEITNIVNPLALEMDI